MQILATALMPVCRFSFVDRLQKGMDFHWPGVIEPVARLFRGEDWRGDAQENPASEDAGYSNFQY